MNPRLLAVMVIGGAILWSLICGALIGMGNEQAEYTPVPVYTPVTPIPMEWPTATPEPIQTNPSMCTGCHYSLPIAGA